LNFAYVVTVENIGCDVSIVKNVNRKLLNSLQYSLSVLALFI